MLITKKYVTRLSREAQDIFTKQYTGRGKRVANYVDVANSFIESGLFLDVINLETSKVKQYIYFEEDKILFNEICSKIISNAYVNDIITSENDSFFVYLDNFNRESLEKLFDIAEQKKDLKIVLIILFAYNKLINYLLDGDRLKQKDNYKRTGTLIDTLLQEAGNGAKLNFLFQYGCYTNIRAFKTNNDYCTRAKAIVEYLVKDAPLVCLQIIEKLHNETNDIPDNTTEQDIKNNYVDMDYLKSMFCVAVDNILATKTITVTELREACKGDLQDWLIECLLAKAK